MTTNNSASGGYLAPNPQFPPLPSNLSFTEFLQSVFVGISGLSGDLVRPSWQLNPPKQPDVLTNWLAIGLVTNNADANAYVGTLAATQATGNIELSCFVTAGSTVTINSVLITFVTASPGANEILIGPTVGATAANLYAFLMGSSNPLLTVANYSLPSSFASNVLYITFIATGAVGNAFTLASSSKHILISGPTLSGGGVDTNILQRQEDLEVQCSFYGPESLELAQLTRDGFYITQNLESLRSAYMGFVSATNMNHLPDLVNERWVDRYIMSIFLRREILRAYPILTFVSASGTIQSVVNGEPYSLAWQSSP